MRRAELEAEGKRFGIQNMNRYTVKELRFVVGAKIAKGSI